MRHKSLVAALLLPIPFAAMPVLAVFVSHLDGSGSAHGVALNPAPIQLQLEQIHTHGHTLAHNVADSTSGCPGDSVPPFEG